MQVTKMHGARNDFVVIDRCNEPLPDAQSFALWICDRRNGVGADGCIVLEDSETADVRLRIVNADGSEAEMCGNGVRCAARWLDEAGRGDRLAFETPAGFVRTEIVARQPEYLVRVTMPRPRIVPVEIPAFPGAAFVDVGNPHVVIFDERVDAFALGAAAALLQRHAQFTTGTNVHVAAPSGRNALQVRHWERGVGLTQACGTGAVACATVAVERNFVQAPVEVYVPGGVLIVQWDADGAVSLIGPAVRVFEAQVDVVAGRGRAHA